MVQVVATVTTVNLAFFTFCQCAGIIAVTEYLLNILLFTLEGYVWGDLIAGEADNGGGLWRRLGESCCDDFVIVQSLSFPHKFALIFSSRHI